MSKPWETLKYLAPRCKSTNQTHFWNAHWERVYTGSNWKTAEKQEAIGGIWILGVLGCPEFLPIYATTKLQNLLSCDFDTALGAVEISGCETRKWKQNWSASPMRGTWLQKSGASYELVWNFQKRNSKIKYQIHYQMVDHQKMANILMKKLHVAICSIFKVTISAQDTSTLGSCLHQNDASSVSEENCQ